MKSTAITSFVAISFLLMSCGNNQAANSESQLTKSETTEKKVEAVHVAAPAAEGIVGTWKSSLEVFDMDGNLIPDEAEMKTGFSENYHFQFNADGTCKIQQIYSGRYERKTEDGLDKLYVYREKIEGEEDKDPIPDVYLVTSFKKDELVLQTFDADIPGSFLFFKRI